MIDALLNGTDTSVGFPDAEADLVLGFFLAGQGVSVSLQYKEGALPALERLDGLIDEVWAMCFRKPRPGWRVLGRFIEKGTFIGLRAYRRSQLPTTEKYSLAAYETIKDWETMFGGVGPHRGQSPADYLGGVCYA
jgi:hypothetical protein